MNRAMLHSEPRLMTIMECVDLSALFPPSLVWMRADTQPDGHKWTESIKQPVSGMEGHK